MSVGNTRRTMTVLSFAPNDVVTATGNETGVDDHGRAAVSEISAVEVPPGQHRLRQRAEEVDLDVYRADPVGILVTGQLFALDLDPSNTVIHTWQRSGHGDAPDSRLGGDPPQQLALCRAETLSESLRPRVGELRRRQAQLRREELVRGNTGGVRRHPRVLDPLGQLEGGRVAILEGRGVVQGGNLLADCVDNFAATMAEEAADATAPRDRLRALFQPQAWAMWTFITIGIVARKPDA